MQQTRYSRQVLFSKIGELGQAKLLQKKVFIVGMGALGTALANHFVRAGIGRLGFIDRDVVEESNLQRQMLFDEYDAAEMLPKAIAAERKLKQINSEVEIQGKVGDFTAEQAIDLLVDADVVVDGTDNFQTRLLINDACYQLGIPYVYGGVVGAQGMSATFRPGHTACLRCFLEAVPAGGDTCDTVGVIGPAVHLVTSIQAAEALKILVEDTPSLRNTMLSFQLWPFQLREVTMPSPRVTCPCCVLEEYPALTHGANQHIATLCGRGTVQIVSPHPFQLDEWEVRLRKVAEVSRNRYLLLAKLPEGERLVLFPEGRIFIQNTEDVARAKTLVAQYIGG